MTPNDLQENAVLTLEHVIPPKYTDRIGERRSLSAHRVVIDVLKDESFLPAEDLRKLFAMGDTAPSSGTIWALAPSLLTGALALLEHRAHFWFALSSSLQRNYGYPGMIVSRFGHGCRRGRIPVGSRTEPLALNLHLDHIELEGMSEWHMMTSDFRWRSFRSRGPGLLQALACGRPHTEWEEIG